METSGWWDVKRWVLFYGTGRVLEPEDLREEILDELRAAQDCYTDSFRYQILDSTKKTR
jgi:hypothetical protein